MKKEPKKSSGLPLAIIVGVLILVVVGAYFLYNRPKPPTSNVNSNAANRPANVSRTPMTASSLGAVPPNMLGSATATVTIEEFADFQCGACAQVHPVMKELQSIYGSRIRFIFRNYPLQIAGHDKAYDAAVATEAVRMQDPNKFWVMQDNLFVNQTVWSPNPNYRELWAEYVQKIGLDVERFKNDMAGPNAKARVDADLQRGRSLNVDSTPTLLVNGKNIPMESINISNLRQVVDQEIQNAMGTSSAPAKPAAAPANAPAPANK